MKRPKNWRKGQTIFNFLAWIKRVKQMTGPIGECGAMIDPFYIPDKQWDELYREFLLEYKEGR